MARTCRLTLTALLLSLLVAAVARSQQSATAPATTTAPAAPATTTAPATAPVPATATAPAGPPVPRPPDNRFIPLADVPAAAERAVRDVRSAEQAAAADAPAGEVAAELPDLAIEIDARLQENAQLLGGRASLDTLRSLEAAWDDKARTLGDWQRELTRRATELNRHVDATSDLAENWWGPNLRYATATSAPAEVVRRMESILATVGRVREAVTRARGRVLALQTKVSVEAARVADAQAAVRAARARVVDRVLVRDSPPVWSAVAHPEAGQELVAEGQRTFGAQLAALRAYVSRRAGTVALHALAWAALVPVLFAARRRVRPWEQEDASVRRAATVFQTPIATATLLAVLVARPIYPGAPRLFWAAVTAAALVPTILILRRLLERRLYALLDALVVFYAVDQVRAASAANPLLARLLLMAELAGGAAFLVWLLRSGRLSHAVGADGDALGRAIVGIARLGGVIVVAAFVAAALGYVTLATLLANATFASAYLAVILYAGTRVADGLVMAAFRVRPLRLLNTVERHRKLYWGRAQRIAQWGAALLWAVITLDMLSVRGIVGGWLDAIWAFGVGFGTFGVTVGQLVTFALTVWAAVLISRFVRFFLEADVYPRMHLSRGLPYAVSTVLHYTILVVGFVAAVGALGYDMTKFTILAGAFGVGLGFGLQNIFNNFVSGLILLFERPVKVGDVIQIGPNVGTVRRIGIRASVVRTASGAEIILPNAKLIADPVTNWTLSGTGRGIEVPLGVAPGTEPRQVMLLWRRVTADHPKVAEDPAPRAAMVGVAADALRFELHAWTTEFESWGQTRSDLAVAMTAALGEAGIGVR